jgi:hypothetical protein
MKGTTMTSRSRKLATIARIALGLVFTLFGADGFLQFLPQPPMPAAAGAFMGALLATGYMLPLLKMVELGAGLLLLSNRHVPLALLLLAPVIVHITAFHVFLAPGGLVMAALIVAMEIYLAWIYRASFAPVLMTRAAPARPTEHTTSRLLAAESTATAPARRAG